jgi:uncharacterized spore protein YtfJ
LWGHRFAGFRRPLEASIIEGGAKRTARKYREEGAVMNVTELLGRARDELTVKRVFGEPVEREGVTVIPVARVMGGGGGGEGEKEKERGSGGGFGVRATPVGVYVLQDGKVSWQPAVDVTRIVLGGQVVGVVVLLTLRYVVRRLTRSRG